MVCFTSVQTNYFSFIYTNYLIVISIFFIYANYPRKENVYFSLSLLFFVHLLNASKMESESGGVGCMAVIAVTGSVVFIAREVHKRLLSDFMKKIEIELGGSGKCGVKRRVCFAENVIESSSNNKEYRKKNHQAWVIGDHHASSMPLNRQVFHKTITKLTIFPIDYTKFSLYMFVYNLKFRCFP
ncbi:hypothetical protein CXB51_003252 [Gossypium anomalum]|uniref:Uncharacterized protein n=1 Tax=Gossypium anomalum TaxID=47600 RepID=A0A8J6D796_9ROSI|nr:hypothetical protein CXB51_003252 [Gossypium anomalum]